MEAATPLRQPHVRTAGDRLVVDALVVQDECAVRLVREREEIGDDAVKVVVDAIEIGARVLDREQAGANADFVKSEFDKVSREVEQAFVDRAKEVAEELGQKVDETFGPESGHLTKALERHFGDDSDTAVQNRVRDVLNDVMAKSREELLRQFSSADGQNPLADFKAGTLRQLREAGERQDNSLRALNDQLSALKIELEGLRGEKQKAEEVEEEREKGTAKGRVFEDAVAEALEGIADAQGDSCDAVGDQPGATGKKGDVIVELDACNGPTRGRVVFEAKKSNLSSKPKAWQYLDAALEQRDADFAVLVVPTEDHLPPKTRPLREYNGDKLLVAWDPDDETTLALEVAYSLARARVLLKRGGDDGVDSEAIRDAVDRALAVVDDAKRIKTHLTGATKNIEGARGLLVTIEDRVRAYLREIEDLAADGAGDAQPDDEPAADDETAADDDVPAEIPGQERLV